jgi:hypothetical protein
VQLVMGQRGEGRFRHGVPWGGRLLCPDPRRNSLATAHEAASRGGRLQGKYRRGLRTTVRSDSSKAGSAKGHLFDLCDTAEYAGWFPVKASAAIQSDIARVAVRMGFRLAGGLSGPLVPSRTRLPTCASKIQVAKL